MLPMYIAQYASYDSQPIRGSAGIDLTHESASDATRLLKFRNLPEKHYLTYRIFDEINGRLAGKGLTVRDKTTVDAPLIAAPPSTKNRDQERDPEMHQPKPGKNWLFGMKAHTGVDAKSGLTHTLVTTARCVTVAWRRTPHSCIPCSRSPLWRYPAELPGCQNASGSPAHA